MVVMAVVVEVVYKEACGIYQKRIVVAAAAAVGRACWPSEALPAG